MYHGDPANLCLFFRLCLCSEHPALVYEVPGLHHASFLRYIEDTYRFHFCVASLKYIKLPPLALTFFQEPMSSVPTEYVVSAG